jgi:copper chaperone CopZ
MSQNASTLELVVEGMHCGSCALLIDDALADLPGILSSATSSKNRAATITHDHRTDLREIITTIESLGYRATPSANGTASQGA